MPTFSQDTKKQLQKGGCTLIGMFFLTISPISYRFDRDVLSPLLGFRALNTCVEKRIFGNTTKNIGKTLDI